MPITEVGVELGMGPAKLSGKWRPDEAERDAAWDLYVELATRVTAFPLRADQGILREALSSYYALFAVTREILRQHGVAVARAPSRRSQYRFGHLAIWMLNAVLRPLLTEWHPELERWEARRGADTSLAEHESDWPRNAELRAELERAQAVLIQYAEVLAQVCEAPALIDAAKEILDASRPDGSAS